MKTHERLKCADRFEPRVDGRDPSGAEHPAEHSAERRGALRGAALRKRTFFFTD